MLALRTGWTDRTIADGISDDFRRACHHALFAERLTADLSEITRIAASVEEIDITTIPTARRRAVRRTSDIVAAEGARLRALMGLDDA